MHSALRAYGLISRNILRVAVVSVVGSLAIFIGTGRDYINCTANLCAFSLSMYVLKLDMSMLATIGKITVMIICAGLAYLYLDNFMEVAQSCRRLATIIFPYLYM